MRKSKASGLSAPYFAINIANSMPVAPPPIITLFLPTGASPVNTSFAQYTFFPSIPRIGTIIGLVPVAMNTESGLKSLTK